MIKVILPGGFFEERNYVVRVLLHEFLGLEYNTEIRESNTAYHIEIGDRHISIQDAFFGARNSDGMYQSADAIPEQIHDTTQPGLQGIVCIYGEDVLTWSDNSVHCGVDLFGSAFFMLSRWEETIGAMQYDMHGRFPGRSSLAYRSGFIHRPVVNEYVLLLKGWLEWAGVPSVSFKQYQYHLSLQTDADTTHYYTSPFSLFRKMGFRLFREGSLAKSLGEVGTYLRYLRTGHDPYDTFDLIMDLAELHQEKACVFFPVGGADVHDRLQVLEEKHVFNMFSHVLMRGHDAGVHFSYRTGVDGSLMRDETQIFLKHAKGPVLARQHYLQCRVPHTWRAWEEVGVAHDYTMGYPDVPGFRCGVCYPFPLFDVVEHKTLQVYEHPLIAMDVTFRNYLKHSPEEAAQACKILMETVHTYQGEFVFLWHNSSFAVDWQEWRHVLEIVLVPEDSTVH